MIRSIRSTFVLALSFLACAPGISRAQSISFEDVSSSAGFSHSGETWGASWGDYNGDGRPDLFANNHRTLEAVYRNNGNGTFTNVANQIEVAGTWAAEFNSDTHGATWADFDNDGDQDLMVANGYRGSGSNPPGSYGWRFFVNEAATLVNRTTQYGFKTLPNTGGRFPGWMDVNNDGLLDLLAMNQNSYAQLYVQNGSGGFTNTGSQLHSCRSNQVMLISDIDVDGRAELICPQKAAFPDKVYDTSTYPAPFRDETSSVPYIALTEDTVLADFNNDLRPDIFHIRGGLRMSGAAQRDGTSVEAQIIADASTEKSLTFVSSGILQVDSSWEGLKINQTNWVYIGAGGYHPSTFQFTLDPANPSNWGIKSHNPSSSSQQGMYIGYDPGTQTWTFSNSPGGYWHLFDFLIDSTSTVSSVAVSNLLAVDKPQKPSLYLNTPSGFTQDLVAAGLNQLMSCVDVVAGDFDNDMDQDLFVVCRDAVANTADRLYQNQGNGTFVRVTGAGGAEGAIGLAIGDGAGTGESVVTADYDSDGFLDLFVTNGLNEAFIWQLGGPDKLFHNRGNGNHWIELDLQGTLTNRDGIGARVIATTPNGTTQLREQNGGYHRWSQNHSRLHFGLGSNTSVALRVEWPSGVVDVFNVTDVDHIYRVQELGQLTLVELGDPPAPSPCGPPTYNKATEQGLFIWKNCTAGTWHARMVAGGVSWVVYRGNIQSSENFTSVTGFSVEANDTLNTSDPANIVYALGVGGASEDGINFSFPGSASVCFNSTAPTGVPIYLGADRTLMTSPFNLGTQGPCN